MVVVRCGFRHALKDSVPDLPEANRVYWLIKANTTDRENLLDVRAVGLLDLAIDIADRRRPRPKRIVIQNKRHEHFRFDARQ